MNLVDYGDLWFLPGWLFLYFSFCNYVVHLCQNKNESQLIALKLVPLNIIVYDRESIHKFGSDLITHQSSYTFISEQDNRKSRILWWVLQHPHLTTLCTMLSVTTYVWNYTTLYLLTISHSLRTNAKLIVWTYSNNFMWYINSKKT